MGRYYDGDIEGKFWFGIQASNDGEYFGAEAQETQVIPYYTKNLELAKNGIDKCIVELGVYKEQFDDFFSKNDIWSKERLAECLNVSIKKITKLLVWYARLELGEKIYKCIKEKGYCSFDAEL